MSDAADGTPVSGADAPIAAGDATPGFAHPWVTSLGGGIYLQSYPDSKAELSGGLAEFIGCYKAAITKIPTPYAWVVELGGMMRASSSDRRAIEALGDDTAAYARVHNAGTAIVAKSRIARGLVKGVYLVKSPPFDVEIVASREAGLAWVSAKLAARREKNSR